MVQWISKTSRVFSGRPLPRQLWSLYSYLTFYHHSFRIFHVYITFTDLQPFDWFTPSQKGVYIYIYKHSNGKSPSWIGNTSSNGGFSIAMLDYRSVLPLKSYRDFQGRKFVKLSLGGADEWSGCESGRVDQLRVKPARGRRFVSDFEQKSIPYLFLTSHLDHFFLMHTIIIVDSCCCFCFASCWCIGKKKSPRSILGRTAKPT